MRLSSRSTKPADGRWAVSSGFLDSSVFVALALSRPWALLLDWLQTHDAWLFDGVLQNATRAKHELQRCAHRIAPLVGNLCSPTLPPLRETMQTSNR